MNETKQPTFEEKLDELLDTHAQEFKAGHLDRIKEGFKALILSDVVEATRTIYLVKGKEDLQDWYFKGRDDLRAEQRSIINGSET